jgi:hypothetical protein
MDSRSRVRVTQPCLLPHICHLHHFNSNICTSQPRYLDIFPWTYTTLTQYLSFPKPARFRAGITAIEMPRAEAGSLKHLSNQMKSKGLTRLRW